MRMKRWHSTTHGKKIIFILVRGDLRTTANLWMPLVYSSNVPLSMASTKDVAVSGRYMFSLQVTEEHLKTTATSTDIQTPSTRLRSARSTEWANIHITQSYVQHSWWLRILVA